MPTALIAVDGSADSIRAAQLGAGLLDPDTDFLFLAVAPHVTVTDTGASDESGTPEVSASAGAVEAHYHDLLRQAAEAAGVEGRFLVEESRPRKRRIGRVICDVATTQNADVVIVGSHGAGHAGEIMMGSVSQYVLHHAPCPVLIIRRHD